VESAVASDNQLLHVDNNDLRVLLCLCVTLQKFCSWK